MNDWWCRLTCKLKMHPINHDIALVILIFPRYMCFMLNHPMFLVLSIKDIFLLSTNRRNTQVHSFPNILSNGLILSNSFIMSMNLHVLKWICMLSHDLTCLNNNWLFNQNIIMNSIVITEFQCCYGITLLWNSIIIMVFQCY